MFCFNVNVFIKVINIFIKNVNDVNDVKNIKVINIMHATKNVTINKNDKT